MNRLATLFTLIALAVPIHANADFKLICRGANLPGIVKEVKEDVKSRLKAANIAFKSVKVSFLRVSRPESLFDTSFTENLTLSSGPNPTVSFAGSFVAPESCNVSAKLRIQVFYGQGVRTSSIADVSMPGTLLYKVRGANDL